MEMALNHLDSYQLENDFLALEVLNYGGVIKCLELKLAGNKKQALVMGLPSPEAYLSDIWYLGACIGPYAGRIKGKEGVELHGGKHAFSKQYWTLIDQQAGDTPSLTLSLDFKIAAPSQNKNDSQSSNSIRVQLTYRLIKNRLKIEYSAQSTAPSLLNLSNHSYFILDSEKTIDHYTLQIKALEVIETDALLMPTGLLVPIEKTNIDFNNPRRIGKTRLDTPFVVARAATASHASNSPNASQVPIAPNAPSDGTLKQLAYLHSKITDISMSVATDQEVLVCFMPIDFAGICFETQGYPNAPQHPAFTQPIISPNKPYLQITTFDFSHPSFSVS